MSSNFDCIGLVVPDAGAFERLVAEVFDAARPEFEEGAQKHLLWTDGSGAALALHVSEDGVDCVTPFFAPEDGLTRWKVRTTEPVDDPDCVHCSGADCDLLDASGEMVTRCTVQWLHYAPYRQWLKEPRTFDLEVVAFGRSVQFFRTAEDFEAAQRTWFGDEPLGGTGKPMRMANNAFMPNGMFADASAGMGERATASFGGQVTRVEQRVNVRTGRPFLRARVATLPGEVDVVFGGFGGEGPHVGDQAWIEAWMVGRPVERPQSRTGVVRRLFS